MKRILRTLTLTLLATTAPAGNLWAQLQPPPGLAAPSAPASARIALVNVGILFREQDKVKDFKARLDVKVKPFEDKAKELETCIAAWSKALKDDKESEIGKLSEEKRKEGYLMILECRRRMQDLEEEYHNGIGCDLGAEMMVLDSEIKNAVKLYAEAHGYHVILAFGEPEKPLPPLKEFARRMTAIDAGNVSFIPLDATNQLDVTRGVLDLLNTTYRATSRRK